MRVPVLIAVLLLGALPGVTGAVWPVGPALAAAHPDVTQLRAEVTQALQARITEFESQANKVRQLLENPALTKRERTILQGRLDAIAVTIMAHRFELSRVPRMSLAALQALHGRLVPSVSRS